MPESQYDLPDWYGEDCVRLRLVIGPFLAKPGQNDVLLQPSVIENPRWARYLTRGQPGLVTQLNETPPVEDLHLHHGTWIGPSYGDGPWFAAGEEKSILQLPQNYGMLQKATDQWLFLHMIHNATAVPSVVYITWDFDFVPQEVAETKYGFTNVRNLWMDVANGRFHAEQEGCAGTCLNPIFNIQKGFGAIDERSFRHIPGYDYFNDGSGRMSCAYPDENCARFNVNQDVSAQQGLDVSDEVFGKIHSVNGMLGTGVDVGTLVFMKGHVHPGGLRTEISLRRNMNLGLVDAEGNALAEDWQERPIYISDSVYWDRNGEVNPLPTSWNFSHGVTGKRYGWAVEIKRGDQLIINGIYDTHFASSYMQMGITIVWGAPGDTSGLDVFSDDMYFDPGFADTGVHPDGLLDVFPAGMCTPGLREDGKTVLCLRGSPTHPSHENNQNHFTGCTPALCPALPTVEGPMVDALEMAGFTYGLADLNTARSNGIPRVKVGTPLTFHNLDTGAYVWHSVTRCSEPCTGPTRVDYPLSDAGLSKDDNMDFDSGDLGVGVGVPGNPNWTFTPDRTGVYSFFCRIHPFMRGAFKVVA